MENNQNKPTTISLLDKQSIVAHIADNMYLPHFVFTYCSKFMKLSEYLYTKLDGFYFIEQDMYKDILKISDEKFFELINEWNDKKPIKYIGGDL